MLITLCKSDSNTMYESRFRKLAGLCVPMNTRHGYKSPQFLKIDGFFIYSKNHSLFHLHQILFPDLLSPHGVIESFVFQEFIVRAIFYDFAFFQDKNLVGVHDG